MNATNEKLRKFSHSNMGRVTVSSHDEIKQSIAQAAGIVPGSPPGNRKLIRGQSLVEFKRRISVLCGPKSKMQNVSRGRPPMDMRDQISLAMEQLEEEAEA